MKKQSAEIYSKDEYLTAKSQLTTNERLLLNVMGFVFFNEVITYGWQGLELLIEKQINVTWSDTIVGVLFALALLRISRTFIYKNFIKISNKFDKEEDE